MLIEIGSCFSRLLNVLRGDRADWTLSAAAHRDGLRCEAWIDRAFELLGRGPGHCARWYLDEIERSRENLAQHEMLGKSAGEAQSLVPSPDLVR